MRSYSYINTVKKIVEKYDGSIPLTSWLKQFFKTDKKFGSKDRKEISHACYCYYRLGNAFANVEIEEKILIGLFLCSDISNKILEEQKQDWNQWVSLTVDKKINFVAAHNEIDKIFPFRKELSNEIDKNAFHLSFLHQPHLFLRVRPGKKEKTISQLKKHLISFEWLNDSCIQLHNQSKIDDVVMIDKEVVVQDYNSQRVFEALNSKLQTPNSKLSVWDCCAASGGKSILLHDYYPGAKLTVSDIRESILINLEKRFKRAGIQNYQSFIADVSSPDFSNDQKFDVVICDAPCSGSGTWSRTPEQISFFKQNKIKHYSDLQKRIAINASKPVKKNGYLVYITCSVFFSENEDVVKFIQSNTNLKLLEWQYLKGYDKKADSLFVATFQL